MEERLLLRIVALALLAFPALLPSSPVHGVHEPDRTVSTTVGGVALTLAVPRQPYPQNALVRVRVTLQNVSHKPVMVDATSAPECAQRGPGVQVLNASREVVYPPAVPWVMASCGPPIFPVALPPGHTLHHAILSILRGPLLRAVASLGPLGRSRSVATPSLRITLTNDPPPTLTLVKTPNLQLVVTPSKSISSHTFYFVQGSVCPQSPPFLQSRSATPRWEPAGTSKDGKFRLLAYCASPVRWVFAGGWLNQPAVTLDFPSR
jgi:hypothetical protein